MTSTASDPEHPLLMASSTGNDFARPDFRERLARWRGRVPRPARVAAKEPIVQFLALGGALFLLHGLFRPPGAAPGGEIVVSQARVAAIARTFARTWQRPPTRAELDALIDDHIRTEVMVREALALGLDRDDTIIRRRLRQKMEFLSEEQASQRTPSDRELGAFLAAHPESFRSEPRLTFRQIFLDPERRGANLAAEATRLLRQLNGPSPPADPSRLGDPLVLVEPRIAEAPQAEVAALFGSSFAEALAKQKPGRWVGPITSGYGSHLVKLEAVTPGDLPPLAQVRPQVEREWQAARRQEQEQAFLGRLMAKYRITRPPLPAAGKQP